MTRARITNAVILALISGAVIWIAMHTYWADVTVSSPLEGEALHNPYYSLQRLTGALGVRTQLVPTLYASRPSSSALLINGIQDDLLHSHPESLAPWVESGGRLIVTGDAVWANAALQKWSGIAPGSRLVDKPLTVPAATVSLQKDWDCAPLTVKQNGVPSGETLIYCAPKSEFEFVSKRVPTWSLSNEYGMQMLRVAIGRGSVTVVPRSGLIGNKSLLRHDHAQIFVDAAQMKHGDLLYILKVNSAEPLLAMLWRLIGPALIVLGIAILCIIARNLPRFGPPVPTPAPVRRSLAEQIRANAAFAWRTRKLGSLRAAVRHGLDDTARLRIASYVSMGMQRRVAAIAELTGVDSTRLSAAMTADAAAAAPVQRAAIVLLEQTRRLLNNPTRKSKGYRA
jgi:hypothetical protein